MGFVQVVNLQKFECPGFVRGGGGGLKFRFDRRITVKEKDKEHHGEDFREGPVSRTTQELFGLEKPVVKLQSACFEKLIS